MSIGKFSDRHIGPRSNDVKEIVTKSLKEWGAMQFQVLENNVKKCTRKGALFFMSDRKEYVQENDSVLADNLIYNSNATSRWLPLADALSSEAKKYF